MKKFTDFRQTTRKIEFAHFYNRIVDIVESYEPETTNVSTALLNAKNGRALIEELKMTSSKFPLTKEMRKLEKNLNVAVSVLKRFLDIKTRQQLTTSADMDELHNMLNMYLRGYANKNAFQKTSVIEKMLATYNASEAMKLQATSGGLTAMLTKISEELEALSLAYRTRRKSISSIQRLRTKEIKRTLYYKLRELLVTIEMDQISQSTTNYQVMADELNQEIAVFNIGSKSRVRRKAEPEEPTPNALATLTTVA